MTHQPRRCARRKNKRRALLSGETAAPLTTFRTLPAGPGPIGRGRTTLQDARASLSSCGRAEDRRIVGHGGCRGRAQLSSARRRSTRRRARHNAFARASTRCSTDAARGDPSSSLMLQRRRGPMKLCCGLYSPCNARDPLSSPQSRCVESLTARLRTATWATDDRSGDAGRRALRGRARRSVQHADPPARPAWRVLAGSSGDPCRRAHALQH